MAPTTIAAASSCMLLKTPFSLKRGSKALSFNNGRLLSKRLFSCNAIYNSQVRIKREGQPETLNYRVFFEDASGKKISPWHDVPLHLGNGVFNFIVEIPKESSAKMEVATVELYTPIKQDTKKGKLRYYPHGKTHLLQTLKLKEHLVIMTLLTLLRLVIAGERLVKF